MFTAEAQSSQRVFRFSFVVEIDDKLKFNLPSAKICRGITVAFLASQQKGKKYNIPLRSPRLCGEYNASSSNLKPHHPFQHQDC